MAKVTIRWYVRLRLTMQKKTVHNLLSFFFLGSLSGQEYAVLDLLPASVDCASQAVDVGLQSGDVIVQGEGGVVEERVRGLS